MMTSANVASDVSRGWMMTLALDDMAAMTSLMTLVGIEAGV